MYFFTKLVAILTDFHGGNLQILHLSIDYLIGNCDDVSTTINKSSHKYGFSDPDDFHSALQTIAYAYKCYCLKAITETELLSNFAHMNPDLQQSIVEVFKARQPEIVEFLLREHNSRQDKLVESFDWDVRFVMGDSSLLTQRRQLTTVTLNCLEPGGNKSLVHFQMNTGKLDEFIKVLEQSEASIMPTVKDQQQQQQSRTVE